MDVVEASLSDLRVALDSGRVTSVGLVAAYLRRIAFYDRHGIRLNAVIDLSRKAFEEARAADERRARGELLSPLDGIPYTAKDSYKIAGMTVSAGSPAFADLVASEDAYVIGRLRAAGAIVLGHTNMPPLANGGMQRGLDGRAESPYNGAFLTAAWWSGSSNGSGTATGASFAAFGLGEETWSSGRAPANNNALCAYTPSWGVISLRGNWPLVPTMDVVVPHTRSMGDMLVLLDVVVADDNNTRGDFWRVQKAIEIPPASKLRPASYAALQRTTNKPLVGMGIGMPTKYLGRDPSIPIRPSVLALARDAAERMRSLGAEVVECDLPVVDTYESKHLDFPRNVQGGLEDAEYLPKGYDDAETIGLCTFALEDFLRANAEGSGAKGPKTLAEVDPELMFPLANGEIPDKMSTPEFGMGDYVGFLAEYGFRTPDEIPHAYDGLKGLNRARKELLEDWMDKEGFTALAWPASCDIAPADADIVPTSHVIATTNGTWVANGNLVPRHLGIPTVTVPMGIAEDIGMPFGLTLAGRGWDDTRLLQIASDVESVLPTRPVPKRTPALPPLVPTTAGDGVEERALADIKPSSTEGVALSLDVVREYGADSRVRYTVTGSAPGVIRSATVTINGEPAEIVIYGEKFTAHGSVPSEELTRQHSQWRVPYGTLIVATVTGSFGEVGAFEIVGGR